jgi:hypothetical protein
MEWVVHRAATLCHGGTASGTEAVGQAWCKE